MVLEIIGLVLAIPVGYLIAWLAKDELIAGRKWFVALIVLSIVVGIFFYFSGLRHISWTSGFVFIVSFISLMKSGDKKWTKKKLK